MIPDANFTLPKAKAHLRVTHNDEDALITSLLDSAVAAAERVTRRAWTERSWSILIDAANMIDNTIIHAELSPVVEAKVFTLDGVGGEVELPASSVVIGASFGHSVVKVGTWSGAVVTEGIAGRVDLKADSGGVPADVYAAAMLYLGDLYENRESQFAGLMATQNPLAEQLLRPYVVDLHV